MDQQLLFFINRTATHPTVDRVMAAASSFDAWWPFLLAGGLALAVFGGFRGRAFLVAAGLAIGLTDAVVVDTIKGLTGRPRPHECLSGVRTLDLARARPRILAAGMPLKEEISVERILPPGGNSFPSGHASNNFAVATVCSIFYRRRGWLAFLPATLVAYSRIYTGAHWPSDVVISCLIGAGIGLLVCAAIESAWGRWGTRWMPARPTLLPA